MARPAEARSGGGTPALLVGGRDDAEVDERELPDPERVVDDDVDDRRRDEPGVELAERRDLLRARAPARAPGGVLAAASAPPGGSGSPPDGVQRPLTLVSCHGTSRASYNRGKWDCHELLVGVPTWPACPRRVRSSARPAVMVSGRFSTVELP